MSEFGHHPMVVAPQRFVGVAVCSAVNLTHIVMFAV
jgi:hypothetical protein